MTNVKKAPDWEKIELEYRAGVKSIRQVALEFDVSDAAIRKRAKRDDWTRDLNAKIQAKADDLVRKEQVRNEVRASPEYKATEKETIDANANLVASIRISHRKDIERSRRMVMDLFSELEHMIGIDQALLLQELGDMMYKPNEKGVDKLNDLYMKIIQLPNRVKSIKDLSDALKTLIGLEREAHGLNKEEAKGEDALTALLNSIAQSNGSAFNPVADDLDYQKEDDVRE